MSETILVTLQIYFVAFCVAMIIAAIIKGLLILIRHFVSKKEVAEQGKEGS